MERFLYVDHLWDSPYAMSAFVALEEKGLPFSLRELALEKKEHHAAEYRASTGRVPALVEGDFWLSESSAIAEYLEEAYPPPTYPACFPSELQQRAVCREVQAWLRSDLLPLREERPTTSIFFPAQRTKQPLSPKAERSAGRLVRVAERWLEAGRTTLFPDWCIADADLGLMLMRLLANGDPLAPVLRRYAEAQWQRPSVRKWVERPRPAFVAPDA